MVSARKTLNISSSGGNSLSYISDEPKRLGKWKYVFFLLIPLVALLVFFSVNEVMYRNFLVTLNEWEIRYDTFPVTFSSSVSENIREDVKTQLLRIEHNGKKRFSFENDENAIKITLASEEKSLFTDYLIPVGHFYWIENSISRDEIVSREIVVQEGELEFISAVLEKHFDEDFKIIEKEDVLSYLKENEESSLSFVTLESLNHKYQVLYLDDSYFLDDLEGGLVFHIGVDEGFAPDFLVNVIKNNTKNLYSTFEPNDLLKINMSGVTALSRNLAFKIEESGDPAYPAQYIADFLGDADLVHTSNEVSFVPGCQPERSMRFCSHPDYIATLEAINANVIELTGNHNNDFGAQYNTKTIEMYKERGWGYYGGGLNEEDAAEILFKEKKDSKIAFIGYNYYDTIHNFHANLAGEDRAGANSFSFEKMERDINEAKEKGAFTIVTFQFEECWSYPPEDVIYPPCYKPLSNPDQREVFRTAVDYGADIVIGSQAHQPQTYEVYEEKPIFYGTGNIFFDQIPWIGTRQGMILSHYIYENRLLQSRITTTLYDDDMRPYVTEDDDRELLLQLLRDARY